MLKLVPALGLTALLIRIIGQMEPYSRNIRSNLRKSITYDFLDTGLNEIQIPGDNEMASIYSKGAVRT